MGSTEKTINDASNISLQTIRKELPQHIFQKSLTRSLAHFAFDAAVLATLFYTYSRTLATYETWSLTQWALYTVWINTTGFFMWSLFCIGHDCGHGSFSDSKTLNAIVGHLTHGFLLVPYWPWARSHAQHHQFHNHKDKDMSHTWSTREEENKGAKILKGQPFLVPFAYAFIYLLGGIADGSHFVPWSKLFRNTKERVQCVVSSGVVGLYLIAFYLIAGSLKSLVFGYGMAWLCYNTWLYAVTYLQHHTSDTRVYPTEKWSFTTGAVETVDRTYSPFGILDYFMHNITNGHVAHHMFYTSIPHYNLMEATKVIRGHLGKSYRRVDGFPIVEFLKSHWFSTRYALNWRASEGIWVMGKADPKTD